MKNIQIQETMSPWFWMTNSWLRIGGDFPFLLPLIFLFFLSDYSMFWFTNQPSSTKFCKFSFTYERKMVDMIVHETLRQCNDNCGSTKYRYEIRNPLVLFVKHATLELKLEFVGPRNTVVIYEQHVYKNNNIYFYDAENKRLRLDQVTSLSLFLYIAVSYTHLTLPTKA